MSPGFRCRSVLTSPVRMAGPWVSMRMATARPSSSAMERMRGTISRTQSCCAWLMLSRKTLAPSYTNCRSVSGFSLAGPSVQMILVLRIGTVNRPAKASCCNVPLGQVSKSFSNMPWKRFYLDRKIIGIALMLIALAPFILAVVEALRHWVPLPYWDEWFSPGTLLLSYAKGTLSFSDFFYQHNERRKTFPYLLYITLAKIHGWDVRDGMVISLLEAAAI